MSLDPAMAHKKLTAIWKDANVPVLDAGGGRFAIMSDIHLGDGGHSDDFHNNESAMLRALKYYRQKGFSLVLLGDIEEFWQFDYDRIVGRYDKTVYKVVRGFGDDRVHRVFGNHDLEWGTPCDPTKNHPLTETCATQALKLRAANGTVCALLLHGHQGSRESDRTSWISRPMVRLFKHVEPLAKLLGLYGHGESTKSMITKDYEKVLYRWAKKQKVILICGHSHRAIFASRSYLDRLEEDMLNIGHRLRTEELGDATRDGMLGEMERLRKEIADEKARDREIDRVEPMGTPKPCYFNTGCALYENGLTVIEVVDDIIHLVKWYRAPEHGAYRELYSEPLALSDCASRTGCR